MFLVRSVATRYYFSLFKCLYIIIVLFFYFHWDHLSHPSYFKNRMPLKPALGLGGGGVEAVGRVGGVCNLPNYSVEYK